MGRKGNKNNQPKRNKKVVEDGSEPPQPSNETENFVEYKQLCQEQGFPVYDPSHSRLESSSESSSDESTNPDEDQSLNENFSALKFNPPPLGNRTSEPNRQPAESQGADINPVSIPVFPPNKSCVETSDDGRQMLSPNMIASVENLLRTPAQPQNYRQFGWQLQNSPQFGCPPQNSQQFGWQLQNSPQFGWPPQNSPQFGWQPQNSQQFGWQPQNSQQFRWQPQNSQQFGWQPQNSQQIGWQPQNSQQFGWQPQNSQQVGWQPQNSQQFGCQPRSLQKLGQQPRSLPLQSSPQLGWQPQSFLQLGRHPQNSQQFAPQRQNSQQFGRPTPNPPRNATTVQQRTFVRLAYRTPGPIPFQVSPLAYSERDELQQSAQRLRSNNQPPNQGSWISPSASNRASKPQTPNRWQNQRR